MFYLYNLDERGRIQSQCSMYIEQDLVTARMTAREMRAITLNIHELGEFDQENVKSFQEELPKTWSGKWLKSAHWS